jgi:hypothetical protein
VTSDNSVGARQPSDCTTVGDHFLRQVFIAHCWVMMTNYEMQLKTSVPRKPCDKQASPTIKAVFSIWAVWRLYKSTDECSFEQLSG